MTALTETFKDLPQLLRSLFRDNAFFYVEKTWNRRIICRRDALSGEFAKVLKDPDAFMGQHVLKSDASNTTTVSLIQTDHGPVVIKRYNIKHFKHGIKRALQPSRAARCWKSAHQLLWFGIATPRPIAMVEKRYGPLRREAYFFYEYIPGPQGFEVFRDQPDTPDITQLRAEKTAALIHKLLEHDFSHGDMKASNFIYFNHEPYFIDLDATRKHRFSALTHKRQHKEIKRFLENWNDVRTHLLFAKLLKTQFRR